MTTKHLSDTDIQNYVLKDSSHTAVMTEHINHCADCKKKAAQYQLLLGAINMQDAPAFDFDLSELVVLQLTEAKPRFSLFMLAVYSLLFAGVVVFGFVFYQFRASIIDILSGSATIITIACLTTLAVMLLQNIDLYKNHQKRMDLLDSY
jgi:hypothetical protein